MVGKFCDFSFDGADDFVFVFLGFAVFEDVLDDVVAELVLGQLLDAL